MITSVEMTNFGLQKHIRWDHLSRINLIIGENSSGKTFVLKAIYTALKTLEQYKKGKEVKGLADILSDKLYWTFQVDKLGDLVTKGENSLSFSMQEEDHSFSYEFGKDTNHQISKVNTNYTESRKDSSIFIPAKEVVSLFQVILKSREQDAMFGFDDTYLDLVKALQVPPMKEKNYSAFSRSRKKLKNIFDGQIVYDVQQNQWHFQQGNTKYPIGVTSEGIKKIAILNRLLSNRYLSNHSIICIDEVDAALHPKAISEYLDIIFDLAQNGIQFFIATHSYFVIKKLCLLSQQHNMSIPVLSLDGQKEPHFDDMKDGMPDNSIIDESIRLYKAEVDMALGV